MALLRSSHHKVSSPGRSAELHALLVASLLGADEGLDAVGCDLLGRGKVEGPLLRDVEEEHHRLARHLLQVLAGRRLGYPLQLTVPLLVEQEDALGVLANGLALFDVLFRQRLHGLQARLGHSVAAPLAHDDDCRALVDVGAASLRPLGQVANGGREPALCQSRLGARCDFAAAVRVDDLALRGDDDEGGNAAHAEPFAEILLLGPLGEGQRQIVAMVVLEVADHIVLGLVAADEHDLEAGVLRLVGCIEVLQLGGEAPAGRAPMCAEVDAQGFASDGLLAHSRAILPDEGVAQGLRESHGRPWEALAIVEVLHDLGTPLCRDDRAIRPENDQHGDALHLELLAQRGLDVALVVRERQPRHLAEVLVERSLVPVARNKDSLEVLLRGVLRVELAQLRREASAGWAPMSREVNKDGGLVGQRICRGDGAVLGLQLVAEERCEGCHRDEREGLDAKRGSDWATCAGAETA
mmetsp:Transcript_84570/g.188882  ORF Transcript_84570/g.188882 Transcript_84570/m.188882 type:complete len:468 (+) Transcript_84570:177-1580(+)